jgi:uncharacterized cupin superfamily protein
VSVHEAALRRTDVGLVPETAGWFVLNAREARWGEMGELGRYAPFEGEGDARFPQVGINVNVMQPGQPSSMYHAEDAQEDFLVLAGEAILVVEGQERRLRQWDFVHCPAWTEHVIVGAGSGPCVFLAIGARTAAPEHVYPVSDAALRHGAGVSEETTSSEEAYRRFPRLVPQAYTDGDLT